VPPPAHAHHVQAVFCWLFLRVAAGSRFWGWLYASGIRGAMVKGLAREAKKVAAAEAAAGNAAATNGAAAVPAAA